MRCSPSIVLGLSAFLAIVSQGFSQPIFDDTFNNGSTINSALSTPTANSTSYETVATKASMSVASISSGDMSLGMGSTSGNGYGVQAQFTAAPVTLATVNDYIQLNITFKDTGGFLTTTNKGALSLGLYNSGGTGPLVGNVNAGNGVTGSATGGAQNWVGYVGQLQTSNQYINTRAAQTSATLSINQDVTSGSGIASTKGYGNPGPSHTGSQTATLSFLTAGDTYTFSEEIQLTAPGTLTISESLYDKTASAFVGNAAVSGTTASPLTQTFDALGFGLYASGSMGTTADISEINVTDSIQTPEPSVFALAGLGMAILAARFRRTV